MDDRQFFWLIALLCQLSHHNPLARTNSTVWSNSSGVIVIAQKQMLRANTPSIAAQCDDRAFGWQLLISQNFKECPLCKLAASIH